MCLDPNVAGHDTLLFLAVSSFVDSGISSLQTSIAAYPESYPSTRCV